MKLLSINVASTALVTFNAQGQRILSRDAGVLTEEIFRLLQLDLRGHLPVVVSFAHVQECYPGVLDLLVILQKNLKMRFDTEEQVLALCELPSDLRMEMKRREDAGNPVPLIVAESLEAAMLAAA